MAIIKNGLISGKLGNKVYYVKDGKSYVRIYVKSKDSNTYKQQLQRAKFGTTTKFLKNFRSPIKIGFQGSKYIDHEFAEAMQYHFNNALIEIPQSEGVCPKFEIDINKVILSRGNIVKPEILNCSREGHQIKLTWDNQLGEITNRYHDVIVMVAYMPGIKAVANFNIGTREEGEGVMNLP
ncbi:MAG: DUF6266 family protein, partial [Bacteroidales bacterium]